MAKPDFTNGDLNLKATELRLGLPGTDDDHDDQRHSSSSSSKLPANNSCKKRSSSALSQEIEEQQESPRAPAPKAQVIGWPPVRSYRKNALNNESKSSDNNGCGIYVKVSMDGAPYLRKIDLKCYEKYSDLLKALQEMFKCAMGVYDEREGCYNGSQHAPAYQDKDGDLMLVGDVPWDMFVTSCRRLRIMKSSEAKGLGCSQ